MVLKGYSNVSISEENLLTNNNDNRSIEDKLREYLDQAILNRTLPIIPHYLDPKAARWMSSLNLNFQYKKKELSSPYGSPKRISELFKTKKDQNEIWYLITNSTFKVEWLGLEAEMGLVIFLIFLNLVNNYY